MKKVIAVLVLFSTMVFAQQKGTFTDPRDNKTYKTVKIVSQTWMAENLNYAASGSKCYENEPKNCKKYGRLYDWNVAIRACPSGWHLPSNDEWDVLMAAVDGEDTAGKKLKAKSGWNNNGNGTDEFGFSALPGGGDFSDGRFGNVGLSGIWWSASEYDGNNAYHRLMLYNDEYVYGYYYGKSRLHSVRCLQD